LFSEEDLGGNLRLCDFARVKKGAIKAWEIKRKERKALNNP